MPGRAGMGRDSMWNLRPASLMWGRTAKSSMQSMTPLVIGRWLLWAVTEAEKDLGGGTGKLKLRQVYDLFVTRFPWLAKLVSFELFSDMVDDALEEMREMLDTNQAVKAFVEGE